MVAVQKKEREREKERETEREIERERERECVCGGGVGEGMKIFLHLGWGTVRRGVMFLPMIPCGNMLNRCSGA